MNSSPLCFFTMTGHLERVAGTAAPRRPAADPGTLHPGVASSERDDGGGGTLVINA